VVLALCHRGVLDSRADIPKPLKPQSFLCPPLLEILGLLGHKECNLPCPSLMGDTSSQTPGTIVSRFWIIEAEVKGGDVVVATTIRIGIEHHKNDK